MDLQDKFERNLEERINRLNTPARLPSERFEIVNSRKFSNVGTMLVQTPSSFTSLVTLKYEFYDDSLTIKMSPAIPGWRRNEDDKSVFYANFGPHGSPESIEILTTVIDAVVAVLT